MRRITITRLQFILYSCLSTIVALSLAYITDLRQEQSGLREVILEMIEVYDENQDLSQQLKEYHNRVNELQMLNNTLEDLLFNRVQTYLIATGKPGFERDTTAILSRSGNQAERGEITALTMPIKSSSGFTASDFERAWQAYGALNLRGTGEALLQAEEEYGINALILAAIVVHESGWGKSVIAREKNNLAGLGAYDGNAYSSAITFADKADSIYFLARLLSRDYAAPGDRYYNGSGLSGIGKAYASDPDWAGKVAEIMRQLSLAVVKEPEAMLAIVRGSDGN